MVCSRLTASSESATSAAQLVSSPTSSKRSRAMAKGCLATRCLAVWADS
jgi:hypothetical protein